MAYISYIQGIPTHRETIRELQEWLIDEWYCNPKGNRLKCTKIKQVMDKLKQTKQEYDDMEFERETKWWKGWFDND